MSSAVMHLDLVGVVTQGNRNGSVPTGLAVRPIGGMCDQPEALSFVGILRPVSIPPQRRDSMRTIVLFVVAMFGGIGQANAVAVYLDDGVLLTETGIVWQQGANGSYDPQATEYQRNGWIAAYGCPSENTCYAPWDYFDAIKDAGYNGRPIPQEIQGVLNYLGADCSDYTCSLRSIFLTGPPSTPLPTDGLDNGEQGWGFFIFNYSLATPVAQDPADNRPHWELESGGETEIINPALGYVPNGPINLFRYATAADYAVVPAPPAVWLLGTAVAGVGGRRWLRRRVGS